MAALHARQSLAAQSIELCVLTTTRTFEVLQAECGEFDLERKVWAIPAKWMKAGHAHRIPLTQRELDILKTIPRLEDNPFVFPGNAKAKPLSGMAMALHVPDN